MPLAASRSLAALLCALALLLAAPVLAQVSDPTPLQFADEDEAKRFHRLASELRCVMCQNQSLADSDAQIANDLRREVLALMQQGRSDREIKAFLVQRYGEFVLYRPQVSRATWVLWFGPLLLLLAGALVVWRIVVRRGEGKPVPIDDGQEW